MAANFDSYLNVEVESLEFPSPPPAGHYFANIISWKTAERDFDKANGGAKTPVAEVSFKITSPDSDVDPDEATAAQASIGRVVTYDYQLNDAFGTAKLRELGEKVCNLPVKGLRLGDLLPMLLNQPVRVLMAQRAGVGSREGQFFPQVKGVISAEG